MNESSIKTDWQTSLPHTGSSSVSVLYKDDFLYAGSSGYVYKLSPNIGNITATNSLHSLGKHEVRFGLSEDGAMLYVGTAGYALALKASDLSTVWQTSLPDTRSHVVSVLFHEGYLYCGSNGYVYKLRSDGEIVESNSLHDHGKHEVRLALSDDGTALYVGTAGYALALETSDLNTIWQTSLPDTRSHVVSVLFNNDYVYCGSNGYVYKLQSNGEIVNSNSLHDCGKHEIRMTFSTLGNMILLGTAGYALALEASDLSTIWQTSLPHTGSSVITPLVSGETLYAGGAGHLYEIKTLNGSIISSNDLRNRGRHELRLAIKEDGTQLFVGTDGYAIGVSDTGVG